MLANNSPLACPQCNIVLLNLDFLRTDYIGLTSDSPSTPNIDRFFNNGIIFDNAYATAGSTYRGNLSVFTATAPHYYAIDVLSYAKLRNDDQLKNWKALFEAKTTIAQNLQEAGYRTFSINKGKRSGKATLLHRGYENYLEYPLKTLIEDLIIPAGKEIQKLGKAMDRPSLIHLHAIPTRLHKAYYPLDQSRIENDSIIYKPYKLNGQPYGYTVISDYKKPNEIKRNAEHTIYRQQLEYADKQLQYVFDALEKIKANTIIVLFSTHGTQIGDNHIFASDGTGFESNIRVPLMILHPKIIKQKRLSQSITLLDLVPTILDMLNIYGPENDGLSLLPLITGQSYKRSYIWGKNDKDDFIIEGKWKLIRQFNINRKLYKATSRQNVISDHRSIAAAIEYEIYPGESGSRERTYGDYVLEIEEAKTLLLYNLEDDPTETTNLISQNPNKALELDQILQSHVDEAADNLTKRFATRDHLLNAN